ncbi:hypothetical protein JCM8097_006276 [Rhodosporidiobolus ruineniae]
MTLRAPASASLIAQSQSLGPDLAPFLASRDPSPAPPAASSSSTTQETSHAGLGASHEVVPADKLIECGVRRSWKEIFTGLDGDWRREVTYWLAAMATATVVRDACFRKGVFGSYLLENLAPVERENPKWKYILAVRAWEMAVGGYIWRRVKGGIRGDGALFGLLFALVTRVSLYAFEHSYFLLSTQTVAVLLLIDIVALSSAFSLLRFFVPPSPEPRPLVSALQRLREDPALGFNVVFGVGFAAFAAAAVSYAAERLGGREFVMRNVEETTVPSYLMADQLTTDEILEHPSWTVPSLRTYDFPLSMPHHLLQSLLTSLATLPFVSVLPSLSPLRLAALTGLVVAVPSALVLWDVMPVNLHAALVVGAGLGARAAWSAGVVGWTIEELRKAKTSRTVKLLLIDEQTDEVLATSTAKLETDVAGTLKKDDKGVTHRRGVVKGEIEL